MINISHNNWLAQLYRLNFRFLSVGNYAMPNTNLCHFMRCVLVWLPLKVISALAGGGFVIYVFIVGPLLEFGALLYLNIVAIIGLLGYAIARMSKDSGVTIPRLMHRITANESISLGVQYIKAVKSKICPFVHID